MSGDTDHTFQVHTHIPDLLGPRKKEQTRQYTSDQLYGNFHSMAVICSAIPDRMCIPKLEDTACIQVYRDHTAHMSQYLAMKSVSQGDELKRKLDQSSFDH